MRHLQNFFTTANIRQTRSGGFSSCYTDTGMKSGYALSDATCTALQLTNFWQDIKRDYAMGRVYLPEEEMRRFGVKEKDLEKDKATDPV